MREHGSGRVELPRRGRDPRAWRRSGRAGRGRRSGHAGRRSRRGQDDLRPRADPPLAGDPGWRCPARPSPSCRSTKDDFPIVHADLYRIEEPGELVELGWEEAVEGALVLVEWPERASALLGATASTSCFASRSGQGRGAPRSSASRAGAFAAPIAPARGSTLLERCGWGEAERRSCRATPRPGPTNCWSRPTATTPC